MAATIHVREISDVINGDLLEVGGAAIERPSVRLEPAVVSEFYSRVQQAIALALTAVRHSDVEASEKVIRMSSEVRQLGESLLTRLAEGFSASAPESSANLRLQTTFVNALRQIFTLTKRIARNACVAKNEIVTGIE
jgi:hypothetical protein